MFVPPLRITNVPSLILAETSVKRRNRSLSQMRVFPHKPSRGIGEDKPVERLSELLKKLSNHFGEIVAKVE